MRGCWLRAQGRVQSNAQSSHNVSSPKKDEETDERRGRLSKLIASASSAVMATRLSDKDMAVAAAYASGNMYKAPPLHQQRKPRVRHCARLSCCGCASFTIRCQGATGSSPPGDKPLCRQCRRARCVLLCTKRRAICRTLMTCK